MTNIQKEIPDELQKKSFIITGNSIFELKTDEFVVEKKHFASKNFVFPSIKKEAFVRFVFAISKEEGRKFTSAPKIKSAFFCFILKYSFELNKRELLLSDDHR